MYICIYVYVYIYIYRNSSICVYIYDMIVLGEGLAGVSSMGFVCYRID